MYLSQITSEEASQLGRSILVNNRDNSSSFEEASQFVVQDLFHAFENDGQPEFSLVRIFRTMHFDNLAPSVRVPKVASSGRYLTLMATIGIEPEWCDRKKSQRRQAIPIDKNMSPMFKGVFKDLGFTWADDGTDEVIHGKKNQSMNMVLVYHIADVSASSQITDQETFVAPYGIQSVFAIGTQFLNGDGYVCIGFTNTPLSTLQAEKLSNISPFLSTLLAAMNEKYPIWMGR